MGKRKITKTKGGVQRAKAPAKDVPRDLPAVQTPPLAEEPASFPQRIRSYFRLQLVLPALIVFLVALPIFNRLIGGSSDKSDMVDFHAHIRIATGLRQGGEAPAYPLFHYSLALLASDNTYLTPGRMAALLLALALAWRAYLSASLLTARNSLSLLTIIGSCLTLAVAMPLPNWWAAPMQIITEQSRDAIGMQMLKQVPVPELWMVPMTYWGSVSPNVWHNPTVIFAMPFALLVFVVGVRALEKPSLAILSWLSASMVISLFAKPNYVLAFAPCFGVALLIRLRQEVMASRQTLASAMLQILAAALPPFLVLAWQFQSAYAGDMEERAGVIFAPLRAWRELTPYVSASLLLSTLFPVSVLVIYRRAALRDIELALAWAVLAVAVAMFALLAETGRRATHGNFGWGANLANHILFVATCAFLFRQPRSISRAISFGILGLHVTSGLICLVRCLAIPSLASIF
jgi:hypothetical protein